MQEAALMLTINIPQARCFATVMRYTMPSGDSSFILATVAIYKGADSYILLEIGFHAAHTTKGGEADGDDSSVR